jgi:site-specific DNA-methyltransferase (adenine-specific)
MRYAKLNWIRHWLIGADPRDVDAKLFSSGSLGRYTAFMQMTLRRVRQVLRDDGFVCLVIGDVRQERRETRLAEIVADVCTEGTDLKVLGLVEDQLPIRNKVSRIWGRTKGRATKIDRILILGASRARLPRQLPAISWCST